MAAPASYVLSCRTTRLVTCCGSGAPSPRRCPPVLGRGRMLSWPAIWPSPATSGESAPRAPLNPRAEGIVVLTGGTSRIDEALQLLAEGRATRLLISGVNPLVTRDTLALTVGDNWRFRHPACMSWFIPSGFMPSWFIGVATLLPVPCV